MKERDGRLIIYCLYIDPYGVLLYNFPPPTSHKVEWELGFCFVVSKDVNLHTQPKARG